MGTLFVSLSHNLYNISIICVFYVKCKGIYVLAFDVSVLNHR